MRQNLSRFWDVNNGQLPSPHPHENNHDIWMREMFCVEGGMRSYVTSSDRYASYTVAPKPYPNWSAERQRFIARMSRDGFEGPVCYYLSLRDNTMLEDEKALCNPSENGKDPRVIDVPVLYMGQTGDWVCRTDQMAEAKEQGLVPDLEEVVLEAGHWWAYEKPGEGGGLIAEWLARRFPLDA
jgi:soluble epoxide hydrolase / lipid-phosphate phosphatase